MISQCRRAVAVVAMLAFSACTGQSVTTPTTPAASFFDGDGARLSYELDLPPGSGPFPALVWSHGSGRVTKDEGRSASSRLVPRGYAVLRYDKRGVGQSTGVYSEVSIGNSDVQIRSLAADLAAGVQLLRGRREIDANRIGLIGASQAGWIVPVAATIAPVRFVILISGPTVPVGDEIRFSNIADTGIALDEVYRQFQPGAGPAGFDPLPSLQQLAAPGLWLFGSNDRSIPVRDSVRLLDELRARGRPFEVREYAGAGHSLQQADFWPDVVSWLDRIR